MSSTIHNRIAVLGAEHKMSRKDLAAAVGVNFQTIGYLERGNYNASLELALKLARLFEVPVEMIFSLDPLTPLSQGMTQPSKDD